MQSKWVTSESVLENDTSHVSPTARPGGPLKPRIESVQNKIQSQISRLEKIHDDQRSEDGDVFGKLVVSIKENNMQYSTMLSSELVKARRLSKAVAIARAVLERLQVKLESASNFGDIVIVLSPAMAVVKNLKSLLVQYVPEMESDLGIISELLSGILMDAGQAGGYTINFETANEEAAKLIEEVSATVELKMKQEFPDIPDLSVPSFRGIAQ